MARGHTGDPVASEVYALTVVDFPNPFVLREHHRCNKCRDWILVYLVGGATCPRDPHYFCCNCRDTPSGVERVLTLVDSETRSQLGLEET